MEEGLDQVRVTGEGDWSEVRLHCDFGHQALVSWETLCDPRAWRCTRGSF